MRVDFLVRWGSRRRIRYLAERVLNNSTAIGRASDKAGSLSLMHRNGILVPQPITSIGADLHFSSGHRAPIVARSAQHRAGNGFWLCLNRKDVVRAKAEGASHFMPYIPIQEEWRVHVFNGDVICCQKKVETEESNPLVRNHENGWRFNRGTPPAGVSRAAVSAVGVHELDFGAVDVGVGDDGRAYVFEVNTGPALSEITMPYYTERIRACVELRT